MLPARYRDHNGPVITLSTAFAKKFNADCVAPALEELANMINNQSNAPKKILVYNPNKYTYNATDWEVPCVFANRMARTNPFHISTHQLHSASHCTLHTHEHEHPACLHLWWQTRWRCRSRRIAAG